MVSNVVTCAFHLILFFSGRIINTYKGAVQSHVRSQAVFNHTEDYSNKKKDKEINKKITLVFLSSHA